MDTSARRSVVEEVVNVLVVGESQEGKSTLIKQLNKYGDLPNVDIKIGDGNMACTKTVKEYLVNVVPLEFRLVDINGETITGLSYPDFCDLSASEARVVEIEDPDATKVRFNFIDTPGLDDSEGEDISNMANIIGRISELTYLNALIYVRNVEKPFSRSFEQFFRYFQRCLPNISNVFIIVHSRFTTAKVDESLADEVDLASLRHAAFKKAMNLSLEHFFMDNNPDRTYPFSILQSLNEMTRLLLHLASQRQMPSTGFKLLKTNSMRNVDIHVLNVLHQLKATTEREFNKERNTADRLSQNLLSAQQEIVRLKAEIAVKLNHINEIKAAGEFLLSTKSCNYDYSFIGDLFMKGQLTKGQLVVEFTSEYEVTQITKSSGSKWLDEVR